MSTLTIPPNSRAPVVSFLKRKSVRQAARTVPATAVISLGAAMMLIPFVWMLSTSLKPNIEVFQVPTRWIPSEILLQNYADATGVIPFWTEAINSTHVAILVVIGSVLSSSLAGYAFARLQARGRSILFVITLSTMMLPYEVTLVPTYLIFRYLGWLDTYNPLIVPAYFGNAFYIFLFRQFCLNVPIELDHAAKIDGCGFFGVYWRIILPLVKPALATIAIFAFLNSWNAFQGPLIYLSKYDLYTIPLGLQFFINTGQVIPWNQMMADSVLAVIPCLVIFFLAQRSFVQGAVLTGLKG